MSLFFNNTKFILDIFQFAKIAISLFYQWSEVNKFESDM